MALQKSVKLNMPQAKRAVKHAVSSADLSAGSQLINMLSVN